MMFENYLAFYKHIDDAANLLDQFSKNDIKEKNELKDILLI